MLFGCVELPALGLEISSRGANPDTPVALVDGNRVHLCNGPAAASGVRPGSTLATAVSVCHGLRHCPRNPVLEQQRLTLLAGAAYRFSAQVSIQESTIRPVALVLDLSGSLKLFGGLYRLKRQLTALFAELGHETAIGMGHTPLAALALARSRVALELPRFPDADAVRMRTLKALRGLPLEHAELDDRLIERLAGMGITTLGNLFELPSRALGRRFGTPVLSYLGRLSGRHSDPRIYFKPAPEFTAALHLLESISSKGVLLFPVQRLTRDLATWLISRQLGVTRLCWTFTPLHGTGVTLTIDLAEGVQNQSVLFAISRLKLDGSELPAEIMSITLSAPRLVPWDVRDTQRSSLFNTMSESRQQTPLALVDQLKARLGTDICHGIALADDCRPEFAWTPTPADLHLKTTAPTVTRRGESRLVPRPLWLLTNPEPVALRHLSLLKGPERIDTGWWSDDPARIARRDYYVARHSSGAHCWVFTDRRETRTEPKWYIHGCFA
jgi:protein ImuB